MKNALEFDEFLTACWGEVDATAGELLALYLSYRISHCPRILGK